jgi:prostasin
MCAGGEGRDACQGFGGAPLVIRENGVYSQVSFVVELLITRWVNKKFIPFQIGIMSFGSDDCGAIRVPSVYTSIAHFAHWITDNSPIE